MSLGNSPVTIISTFGCRLEMDSAMTKIPKLVSYVLVVLILLVPQWMTTDPTNLGIIASFIACAIKHFQFALLDCLG